MKKPLENLSEKAQILAVILATVISALEAFYYSGIYRLMIKVELALFGAYWVFYTWFVTLIFYFFVIAFSMLPFFRKKASRGGVVTDRYLEGFLAFQTQYKNSIGFFVVSIVFLGLAVNEGITYLGNEDIKLVELADIENKNIRIDAPVGLSFKGRPLLNQMVSLEENHISYAYIPLESINRSNDVPIALILEVNVGKSKGIIKDGAQTIKGVVSAFGIPSNIRDHMAGSGLSIQDDALLLEYQVSGQDALLKCQVLGLLGIGCLAIAAFLAYRQKIQHGKY
jgi:hypothetical protein